LTFTVLKTFALSDRWCRSKAAGLVGTNRRLPLDIVTLLAATDAGYGVDTTVRAILKEYGLHFGRSMDRRSDEKSRRWLLMSMSFCRLSSRY
jgi:hypothetical protein